MAALGVSFFPQGLRYTDVMTLGTLAEARQALADLVAGKVFGKLVLTP